jgi:hypothetical protein
MLKNTVAYFAAASVMKRKSFIILALVHHLRGDEGRLVICRRQSGQLSRQVDQFGRQAKTS